MRVFKGFKRLRAGKRQAWTPIRSHWCVALGCLLAAGWSMANGRLGPPWRVVRVLSRLMVFKGFKRLRAGKRQAWTPIRSHWCVALGCLLDAGWSMANGRLGPPWRVVRVLRVFKGFKGLRAGKRQAWTPIRSHWCVALGCLLAAGWSMANGRLGPPWRVVRVLSLLRVFKGFKGLRAGKRQAWTPIRSHWCVALGCLLAAGWSMANGRLGPPWRVVRVLSLLRVFKGFKGLRAGKRQAWTPIRSHWCVALGCLLAAGWSMANGRLGPPWRVVRVLSLLRVFKGFKRLRAGKRQAWTPIRSHWCVALGCRLAAGWSMANGRLGPPWRVVRVLSLLRVFKSFKGLRAGKRQAWTPIRSHWCVALGCLLAAGWSMANGRLGPPWRVVRVLSLLMVFKGFKGLRAGKRQAWTPIRSHWCVALGCLLGFDSF